MYQLRLIWGFFRISTLNEMAYRTNFYISLLHALLNFITGILAIVILFDQVETIQGWNFNAMLAILGVYLTVSALQDLFIGPSLDALAGLGGDIWTGRFDFTLLRPVNIQFLVSIQKWRPFTIFNLLLGLGTLCVAVIRLQQTFNLTYIIKFMIALSAGMTILYSILLIFAALVFISPGFLFTWVFNGLFQMARYPVGIYPGWIRLILTWIIPVGIITTIPAEALTGNLSSEMLLASTLFAIALLIAASTVFRRALWRYASASS
jgi:ABC-2 type transport system permease protein